MKVGCHEDGSSSDDSELDEPLEFKELLESNRTFRRKQSVSIRPKMVFDLSSTSSRFMPRQPLRDSPSPKKF